MEKGLKIFKNEKTIKGEQWLIELREKEQKMKKKEDEINAFRNNEDDELFYRRRQSRSQLDGPPTQSPEE